MCKYFWAVAVLWAVMTAGSLPALYVLRHHAEVSAEALFELPAAARPHEVRQELMYVPATATVYSGAYQYPLTLTVSAFMMWQLAVICLPVLFVSFFLLLYFRRRYRRYAEAKNREFQELNRAKDRFFSVIAHDLKTPAANIESLSKTLKESYDFLSKEEQKECIDMLVESSRTHNELLNTLLDLSRLRLGSKQYSPEKLEVCKLVDTVLEQTKLQAQQKHISQLNQCDECFVKVDENMITTVLRNIVVNAVKFTHSGGQIVVRTCRKNTKIVVSVTDTGVGISDTLKSRIFEVDYNKSSVGTANESGTGLGLVLCKEYVECNGGSIWLESEVGKGTTFFFTLPVFI